MLTVDQGVLLAVLAFGLGGFTIARPTLETVGDDITELPVLASLLVSVVGTVMTVLSVLGIPASLAVGATSTIIGLGWGRASQARRWRNWRCRRRSHRSWRRRRARSSPPASRRPRRADHR